MYGTLCFQDVKGPTPVIVGSHTDGFNVSVEEELLLSDNTARFRNAVEAWFATYWTFSLCYPAKLCKTLTLIEHSLVKCGSKTPAAIKSWAARLGLD